jgi:hypothetical protein
VTTAGGRLKANSSCPSCPSWLISPAFHERRTKNFRATRADDGHGAASSLCFSRTRILSFRAPKAFGVENGAVGENATWTGRPRGRASGRERVKSLDLCLTNEKL